MYGQNKGSSATEQQAVQKELEQADTMTNETARLQAYHSAEKPQKKSPTPLQDSLGRLGRDKRAMASLGVIVFLILLALDNIPIVGANGNARLVLVSLALAFTSWPLMARYVRGQTLQLKEQQFIEAARTSGTTNIQIILQHIVPNLFSIVVIASTLNIANTIVGEAGISLLGLGVQSPGSSLGLMIADGASQIDSHPWEVLLPSLVLTIIVLAFSFLGDGLRDAFDPRAKD